MNARYCSARGRMAMRARSTFCSRASVRSRSIGPSKPSSPRSGQLLGASLRGSSSAKDDAVLPAWNRFRSSADAHLSRCSVKLAEYTILTSPLQRRTDPVCLDGQRLAHHSPEHTIIAIVMLHGAELGTIQAFLVLAIVSPACSRAFAASRNAASWTR